MTYARVITGKQSVVSAGGFVLLEKTMPTTDYVILFTSYDANGATVGTSIGEKKKAGFKATPLEDATVEFIVATKGKIGNTYFGSASVKTTGTVVPFLESLRTLDYGIIFRCFDSAGATIGCTISARKKDSITVTPLEDATFEYMIVAYGFLPSVKSNGGWKFVKSAGASIPFAITMADSSYNVLLSVYDDTGATIGATISNKMTSSMTITPLVDSTVEWVVVGGGVELGFDRLSRDWTAKRVWKEAIPEKFYAVGDFQIRQINKFEVINEAVTAFIDIFGGLFSSSYMTSELVFESNGTMWLNDYRIMRSAGQIVKLNLESSALENRYIEAVSRAEFDTFLSYSIFNKKRIIMTFEGERLLLKKGDSLTSFSDLTLHYPRIPIEVGLEDDFLDVPDGVPIAIVILLIKKLIAQKFSLPAILPETYPKEMGFLVQSLYQSANVTTSQEEIFQKMKAIL